MIIDLFFNYVSSLKVIKYYKSIDFISEMVKPTHIKSSCYMWVVAKLSQNENKTATFPITINYRNITNGNR